MLWANAGLNPACQPQTKQENYAMTEYIHLIGTEDVRAAGNSMKAAAEITQRAAASIEDSLSRHRIFLDEKLSILEQILAEGVRIRE